MEKNPALRVNAENITLILSVYYIIQPEVLTYEFYWYAIKQGLNDTYDQNIHLELQ